jgi:hypothetical protein
MIDLLTARARSMGLSVAYVSVINFGDGAQMGRLGGWDARRQEIQIMAREKRGRVFLLAHELMHAELAQAYEWRPSGCAITSILEMEEVVHSATESCLETLGVSGYRAFCKRTGREYHSRGQLSAGQPRLGELSTWLSELCMDVWRGDMIEAIEAGEI